MLWHPVQRVQAALDLGPGGLGILDFLLPAADDKSWFHFDSYGIRHVEHQCERGYTPGA